MTLLSVAVRSLKMLLAFLQLSLMIIGGWCTDYYAYFNTKIITNDSFYSAALAKSSRLAKHVRDYVFLEFNAFLSVQRSQSRCGAVARSSAFNSWHFDSLSKHCHVASLSYITIPEEGRPSLTIFVERNVPLYGNLIKIYLSDIFKTGPYHC